MVGDDCQSLYKFRGAQVQKFIDLALQQNEAGRGWTVFKLESNYRSGDVICNTANRLIEHNANRIPKVTRAMRQGGTVSVHECATPSAELSFVLQMVQARLTVPKPLCHCGDFMEGHAYTSGHAAVEMEQEPATPASEIAVLARTNRLADSVAQHLRANGVPVRQAKQRTAPGDWRRAKLLLAVIDNPFNDMLVLQLLKATPSGPDAAKAKLAADTQMVCVSEALGWPFGMGEGLAVDVDLARHGLSAESRERIHDACRELSGGGEWAIPDLLLYLAAQEDAVQEEGEGVTCCTIHAAKGREFQTVVICGVEEGYIPNHRKDEDISESRRLAYVGVTRAKDNLILTFCKERPQNRGANMPVGPMEPRQPSRFIAEMGLPS